MSKQVVPVPRQALAAATLAVGPADSHGDVEANLDNGDISKEHCTPSVKLCEKMVRQSFYFLDLTIYTRCLSLS